MIVHKNRLSGLIPAPQGVGNEMIVPFRCLMVQDACLQKVAQSSHMLESVSAVTANKVASTVISLKMIADDVLHMLPCGQQFILPGAHSHSYDVQLMDEL